MPDNIIWSGYTLTLSEHIIVELAAVLHHWVQESSLSLN